MILFIWANWFSDSMHIKLNCFNFGFTVMKHQYSLLKLHIFLTNHIVKFLVQWNNTSVNTNEKSFNKFII